MSAVKRKWKDDQENEEGQENQLSNKKMKNTVPGNDQEIKSSQEKINTKQECAAYALSIIAPHYSPSQIGVFPLLGYLEEKIPMIKNCTASKWDLMCWKDNKAIHHKNIKIDHNGEIWRQTQKPHHIPTAHDSTNKHNKINEVKEYEKVSHASMYEINFRTDLLGNLYTLNVCHKDDDMKNGAISFHVKKYDIASGYETITEFCIKSIHPSFSTMKRISYTFYQISDSGRFMSVSLVVYFGYKIETYCFLLDLDRRSSRLVLDQPEQLYMCNLHIISEPISKEDEKLENQTPVMILTWGGPYRFYYKIIRSASEWGDQLYQSIFECNYSIVEHGFDSYIWRVPTPEGIFHADYLTIFYTDYLTNTTIQVYQIPNSNVVPQEDIYWFSGRLVNDNKFYCVGHGVMFSMDIVYRLGK
jgi:hypothetical protein